LIYKLNGEVTLRDPLSTPKVRVKLYIFESETMNPADVRVNLLDGSGSMGAKSVWWR